VEIERQAEEDRLDQAREAQRQASERDAAAAATTSVLGVAGSTVKKASGNSVPGVAATGGSNSRSVQSNDDALPEPENLPPAAAPSSAVGGATTFATGDNTNGGTPGTSTNQAAVVAAGPQQSFPTGNNVVEPFNQGDGNGVDAAADDPVPISSFIRTNYVAPIYPRAAQRRNVSGSVDVMFTVSTLGAVTEMSVLHAEPGETFNQAAMNAVAQWRFEPVIENGVAVEKRTAVRLSFNLQ